MADLEAQFTCTLPRVINDGPRAWSMTRNRRGHRTYEITYRIAVDRTDSGPLTALEFTPGLPEVGSQWDEGGVIDEWAFFTQEAKVVQADRESDNQYFDVTMIATSEPDDYCPEENKEDPLAVAPRIRIESVDYQREGVFDSNGDPIVNSAFEQFRGAQVEFDHKRYRVIIEQNVAHLEFDLVDSLMNNLNDLQLWGFPAGSVKFSRVEAQPLYYTNCQQYYLRRLMFDIDGNGFTRRLLDEGTKALHGRWDQSTGAGATVTITVGTNGEVTGVTGFAGGSGYPRSCIVPLKISPGGGLFTGTYSTILVETNSFGVVTAFIRIHIAGTGYTAGLKSTIQRGNWVLLRLNGNGDVPDPDNPQHFDRMGDIKAQNARFILDGKGIPINDMEDAGEIAIDYYASGNLYLLGIPDDLEIP